MRVPYRPTRLLLSALAISTGTHAQTLTLLDAGGLYASAASHDGRLVYGSSLNPKTGRAEAGRGARARDRQRNAASGRVSAATAPVIQQAIAPAAIAFGASATISSRRSGTTAPRAPIWTAIDGMFAKPQRA